MDYIKRALDEYLEFDSSLLFNSTDYLVIFGGALRDIVSNHFNSKFNDKINDIDILCLSKSYNEIKDVLISNSYDMIDLYDPNIIINYDIKHLIFEPHTYSNKNGKIIQIIRPNTTKVLELNYKMIVNIMKQELELQEFSQYLAFYILLENVDLSSSGLFWDGNNIYESIPHAYELNKNRKFYTLPTNLMVNEHRLINRKYKLLDRDWKEIRIKDVKDRFNKVANILSDVSSINDFQNKLNFTQLVKNKYGTLENFITTIRHYDLNELPF